MDYKNFNGNKGFRLLNIYERLNRGELVNKSQLAESFSVTTKTIQRDIDDLRAYLAETHSSEIETTIEYDRRKNSYHLIRFEREWLTNEEVLATCKILLESRAFTKKELTQLINKLIIQVVPSYREEIKAIIRNEYHFYIPLKHGKPLMKLLWKLTEFINSSQIITFNYIRQDGKKKFRKVKPVAVLFSEFYFYLMAYFADDSKAYPAVFRVDRISDIADLGEKFTIPYSERFSDIEFRKRVQFMYVGNLMRVQFDFSGPSLEAILDRIPTAEVIRSSENIHTIRAETYGNGLEMWLRTQGENVQNFKIIYSE